MLFVPFLKTDREHAQVRIDTGVNKDDIEEQTFLLDGNKIRLYCGVQIFIKMTKTARISVQNICSVMKKLC
jgi:hypothetical protein